MNTKSSFARLGIISRRAVIAAGVLALSVPGLPAVAAEPVVIVRRQPCSAKGYFAPGASIT